VLANLQFLPKTEKNVSSQAGRFDETNRQDEFAMTGIPQILFAKNGRNPHIFHPSNNAPLHAA